MFVALAWKFLLIVATIQNVFVTCGQENNNYEWCLYKFYNQNKTWFDAKAICEKENMILAHIPAAQQYSYLYNLMNNILPALFARPPGSVWVGAYRAEGEEAKWQNECSVVKTSYWSSADNSNEACFLLANSRTLDTESCNSKLPFVCQESSLGNCVTLQYHIHRNTSCYYYV